MRSVRHVLRMPDTRNEYKILVELSERNKLDKSEDNIKNTLAQDTVTNLDCHKKFWIA